MKFNNQNFKVFTQKRLTALESPTPDIGQQRTTSRTSNILKDKSLNYPNSCLNSVQKKKTSRTKDILNLESQEISANKVKVQTQLSLFKISKDLSKSQTGKSKQKSKEQSVKTVNLTNYTSYQPVDSENKVAPIIHYKQSKVKKNKQQLNNTTLQMRKQFSVPAKPLGLKQISKRHIETEEDPYENSRRMSTKVQDKSLSTMNDIDTIKLQASDSRSNSCNEEEQFRECLEDEDYENQSAIIILPHHFQANISPNNSVRNLLKLQESSNNTMSPINSQIVRRFDFTQEFAAATENNFRQINQREHSPIENQMGSLVTSIYLNGASIQRHAPRVSRLSQLRQKSTTNMGTSIVSPDSKENSPSTLGNEDHLNSGQRRLLDKYELKLIMCSGENDISLEKWRSKQGTRNEYTIETGSTNKENYLQTKPIAKSPFQTRKSDFLMIPQQRDSKGCRSLSSSRKFDSSPLKYGSSNGNPFPPVTPTKELIDLTSQIDENHMDKKQVMKWKEQMSKLVDKLQTKENEIIGLKEENMLLRSQLNFMLQAKLGINQFP